MKVLRRRRASSSATWSCPASAPPAGFGGKRTDTETFYTFTSFATPPSIYRYDLDTGESKLFRQAKVKFDPDEYEVKQVFYTSKDGTKVPMFIAHKKGLKLDGTNPTLLYGYGGFNISLTPGFSVSRLPWMEMGGVFAVANLRGGGEYGEDWHQAGTKLNKQNVFDDFIAAAEYLIKEKYTSAEEARDPGRQQRRPARRRVHDAAAGPVRRVPAGRRRDGHAALPQVHRRPVLGGRLRLAATTPSEFKALYAYRPYHNSEERATKYPATLVTTADTDDRVVPGHSFKFAAAAAGDARRATTPVLIRIETKAGHGAGKPTAKIIEEVADQWAFLVKTLDFKPTIGK